MKRNISRWYGDTGFDGALLRDCRRELGWTQEYLAERADKARAQISAWERGDGITYSCLEDLATALGVSRATLCRDE